MSASHWQGVSRAPLRVGLAAFAALIFLLETWVLADQLADPFYVARAPFLLEFVRPTTWMLVAVYLLGLAGLVAVALGRAPLAGGVLALATMGLVYRCGAEIFGDPSHNFLFVGAVLFGWLMGLAWARWLEAHDVPGARTPELRDGLAESGAVAVLTALYVGSGITKVLQSGLDWFHPDNIRAVLLAQQGLAHVEWIDAYRNAIIESPLLSQTFAALALVIELGAFALLVNRPMRAVWGLLLFGLHLNILVLAHIAYQEPMFFLPLFTFPWPALLRRLRGRPAPVAPAVDVPFGRTPFPTPLFATMGALFLLGLVLGAVR